MGRRVGGIIAFKIDEVQYLAKGSFTYGYGKETRTTINGVDKTHGFYTSVAAPFIEGEITDDGSVTMADLAAITDSKISIKLGNGKTFTLFNAWSLNPDGVSGETQESNFEVRFEGLTAEEIT